MPVKIHQEDLQTIINFDLKTLGQRLKNVRLHISEHNSQKVTQGIISEMLGLNHSNVTLSNLEAGKGAINNFIKLISLYHTLGYNINWIILPNNQYENMTNTKPFNAPLQTLMEVDINEIFNEKRTNIKNALNALNKAENELKEFLK